MKFSQIIKEAVVYSNTLRDMGTELRVQLIKKLDNKKFEIIKRANRWERKRTEGSDDIVNIAEDVVKLVCKKYYPDVILKTAEYDEIGATGREGETHFVTFNLYSLIIDLKVKDMKTFIDKIVMTAMHEYTHIEDRLKNKKPFTEDQVSAWIKKFLKNMKTYLKAPQEQKAYALNLAQALKSKGYTKKEAIETVSKIGEEEMGYDLGAKHYMTQADRKSKNAFLRNTVDYIEKIYADIV
jgi:hypothetical protein